MPTPHAADGEQARYAGVWTADKLFYLQRYATAFMTAMAPKRRAGLWDALVYIDLLAGPGIDIDRKSGEEFLGSPLIAVKTTPAFDHIFLGELGVKNVSALQRRIPAKDPRIDLQ